MPNTPALSRRATFAALSVTALTALTRRAHAGRADIDRFRDVCFLTPQSIEGPFYLDPKLVRTEIAEGRAGVPLRVDLRVIDGAACKPSKGARVDIWHADAQASIRDTRARATRRTSPPSDKNFSVARNSPTAGARSASRRSIRAGTPAAPRIFISRCLSMTATSSPDRCIFPTRSTSSSTPTFPPMRAAETPAPSSMPTIGLQISTTRSD